jgi:hypothetical protein
MPRLGPIKREAFIKKLKALGFDGPFPGKRHEFMVIGAYSQTIPSDEEYSRDMHSRLLKQVCSAIGRDISREEWQAL